MVLEKFWQARCTVKRAPAKGVARPDPQASSKSTVISPSGAFSPTEIYDEKPAAHFGKMTPDSLLVRPPADRSLLLTDLAVCTFLWR